MGGRKDVEGGDQVFYTRRGAVEKGARGESPTGITGVEEVGCATRDAQ